MTIQDLKNQNLILFEVISGSKSFGLDTPTSDTDIKGVFYLPKNCFFGLNYIPQISNETNDEVYYELGRFVELLIKNNPNILEILATPDDCILYKHPIMERLQLQDFLSKLCKDSFAGYAYTQIKKARGLHKKIVNPMEKERKSVLDFCYIIDGNNSISLPAWMASNSIDQANCGLVNIPHVKGVYALYYDATQSKGYKGIIKSELSNEVTLSSIPKGEKEMAFLYCHADGYSVYCKQYAEYWDWVNKRNQQRYETNEQHGKNYDSKNMMHTMRLLQSAYQILSTNSLQIRVTNREELLAIKAGTLDYDSLMQQAESLIEKIEESYTTSTLIDEPNAKKSIENLIEMRKILYQE